MQWLLSIFRNLLVLVFLLGWFWYGKLFRKQWINAVRYQCACGANLSKGENCTCKKYSTSPMFIHFVSTMLVGLMYFALTSISILLSLIVIVAISASVKASLLFQISERKRYVSLAFINVGYFFLASLLFILFSLL